jgi:hypothetical protein
MRGTKGWPRDHGYAPEITFGFHLVLDSFGNRAWTCSLDGKGMIHMALLPPGPPA